MAFVWFILFALIAAIIGGVLQANHNAKKTNKELGKLRNYNVKVNGKTYSRNFENNPITNREMKESERRLQEVKSANMAWQRDFNELMKCQQKGQDYEKAGNTEAAINAYLECVEFGENSLNMRINNYLHSVERLAILYRKQKRYADEVNILKLALQYKTHPTQESKLNFRLTKAEELLTKNSL